MATISIGDALSSFLKSARWQTKINEIRIQREWEKIMGATIARYTRDVQLREGTLIITTDVAPLKHELQFGKQQMINNINEYFKDIVVKDVVVK
jgi:predicted nucleic acid-binding Zn ribbon protein